MKKIIITLILGFACILVFPVNKCFGISENFKFVIDTVGIPRYNVYGDEINEDVYNTYNVFVYSNPLAMYGKTNTQRFKAVPIYGKWTQDGGPYNGYGVQGEYYVLGTSYSGQIVDNVYFPADARPIGTPDTWNYISFAGAYESWFDKNNYKSEEQLEYMKNTFMLFDADNFKSPPTGKLDLVSYGITANSIGLNKARLNTASTWKTMGVISTKKRDAQGRIWNSIFSTAPMAASANIKSSVIVQDNVILDEMEDEITIPVKFSADAINLNDYAKEKHIKQICSTIYINGEKKATVLDTKTKHVEKTIEYKISREEYNIEKTYPLNIRVESYLYTEFSVDGLMQDSIDKTVYIQVNPKKMVPVKDLDVKLLEKRQDENLYVRNLIETVETRNSNSKGIVEAGRYIVCKLNLNVNSSDINSYKVILNGKDVQVDEISKSNDKIIFRFNVDKNLENTITSWNWLRNKNNNYFEVRYEDVGKRIKEANKLQVVMNIAGKEYEYFDFIDSIDNYDINSNYVFNRDVINYENLNQKQELNEWIKS